MYSEYMALKLFRNTVFRIYCIIIQIFLRGKEKGDRTNCSYGYRPQENESAN